MSEITKTSPHTTPHRLSRLILPVFVAASVAGCAAMEGVNVGANVPLGGIVNVGVNKTIGDGQSTTQKQNKPGEVTQENESEEE